MRKALALLRANWMIAVSYRFNMVLAVGSLLLTIVPIYFVTDALQPVMAESIRTQGGEYFGFLIIGMITYNLLGVSVNSIPRALNSGIGSGTLEALLSTPTRLPTLLAGLVSYDLLWSLLRGFLMVVAAAVLGAYFAWGNALLALAVVALILLAYLPFGLFTAALVVAFRTTGPLPRAVLTASVLLGGVYYPTNVIPSWIKYLSELVPLTYGLRALRRVFLEGMSVRQIAPDLAALAGITVVLLAASILLFQYALRYAKRAGTLAHY